MATLTVKPLPASQQSPGERWQLLVSGRRVDTFALKEGAMDAMEGRANPGDTKKEFNRNGQLVREVEHADTDPISFREFVGML